MRLAALTATRSDKILKDTAKDVNINRAALIGRSVASAFLFHVLVDFKQYGLKGRLHFRGIPYTSQSGQRASNWRRLA